MSHLSPGVNTKEFYAQVEEFLRGGDEADSFQRLEEERRDLIETKATNYCVITTIPGVQKSSLQKTQ